MQFKEKALVTGHTRGIGKAIFKSLNEEGINVTGISSKRIDLLEDYREIYDKVSQIAHIYGPFDMVVNNAGINEKSSVLNKPDYDSFEDIVHINTIVPYVIISSLIENDALNDDSRIVNIASISSEITMYNKSSYTASKFGLVGLTKSMAVDLADRNILVNAVSPGITKTDMTKSMMSDIGISKAEDEKIPLGRLAEPEEISEVVKFLCSLNNSYMTGANIIVDGGYTCL